MGQCLSGAGSAAQAMAGSGRAAGFAGNDSAGVAVDAEPTGAPRALNDVATARREHGPAYAPGAFVNGRGGPGVTIALGPDGGGTVLAQRARASAGVFDGRFPTRRAIFRRRGRSTWSPPFPAKWLSRARRRRGIVTAGPGRLRRRA